MMKISTAIVLYWLCCSHALAAEPAQPSSPPQGRPAAPASDAQAPRVPPTPEPSRPASAQGATPARGSADRLELDTTVVTGNRELPKVLYIVPWKKADIGDLPAQPFNTLLDEALTPLDRDVFRREVTYYGAIAADEAPSADRAPRSVDQTGRSEK